MSLELNPKRNRLGWLGRLRRRGVGEKNRPTTIGLEQLIAMLRYTRRRTIAQYFRQRIIPWQTPKP